MKSEDKSINPDNFNIDEYTVKDVQDFDETSYDASSYYSRKSTPDNSKRVSHSASRLASPGPKKMPTFGMSFSNQNTLAVGKSSSATKKRESVLHGPSYNLFRHPVAD